MKPVCPKCGGVVATADVNIQTNVLLCRKCNEMFPLVEGDLPEGGEVPVDFSLDAPPAGAWHDTGMDGETAGATCRGIGGLLFSFVFMSMFGGVAVTVLLGLTGEDKTPPPVLFMLPFLAVGLGAGVVFLLKLMGKTAVTIGPAGGEVFTGVGPIGWRKSFQLDEIERAGKEVCGSSNGQPMHQIALYRADGKKIKFGMLLSQARQDYLRCATIQLLEQNKR